MGEGDGRVVGGHRRGPRVEGRDAAAPVGQPGAVLADPSPWVQSATTPDGAVDDPAAEEDQDDRPELAPVEVRQVQPERPRREEPGADDQDDDPEDERRAAAVIGRRWLPGRRRAGPSGQRVGRRAAGAASGVGAVGGSAGGGVGEVAGAARLRGGRPGSACVRCGSGPVDRRAAYRPRRGRSRRSSPGRLSQIPGQRRTTRRRRVAHDADTAEIGVFGGSGFYSLLEDVREVKVDTPYGAALGFDLPGRGRRPAGRLPAAPRSAPHHPAAPDQLPRQRLGDALARRQGGHLAVRRRLAPAPGQARRLRRVRPVRRPHVRPAPTRSTTARS